jgi:hypothetical protein
MNVKRTLILGAGCGALAVWLSAAATSNMRSPLPISPTPPTAIDIGGAELSAEIARLHERLRPTATPVKSRDLFHYAGRSPRSRGALDDANPATPSSLPLPMTAPAAAPLRLVGIAEDPGADGPVRTAILSASGELFFVKEGETIALRYRIVSISPAGAEVTDLADNATLRLALK